MLFSYFLGGFKNTFTKVSKSTEVQKKDNSKTEKSEPTAGELKLVFFDCEPVSQSCKPLFMGKNIKGPFWSYQLNSLPQNWAKLAKSAMLFSW